MWMTPTKASTHGHFKMRRRTLTQPPILAPVLVLVPLLMPVLVPALVLVAHAYGWLPYWLLALI